jgi:hypothetical protein
MNRFGTLFMLELDLKWFCRLVSLCNGVGRKAIFSFWIRRGDIFSKFALFLEESLFLVNAKK